MPQEWRFINNEPLGNIFTAWMLVLRNYCDSIVLPVLEKVFDIVYSECIVMC